MTSRATTKLKPAKSQEILRRRIKNFFGNQAQEQEIGELFNTLARVGRVAIFGGVLRDLALDGLAARPRDIDVVVECDRRADLAMCLTPFRPERNRFGGFRYRVGGWLFDTWCTKDTWAVKEGLVEAQGLDDLVRTTYFDWDAALYEVRSASFAILPDYFQRLASSVVDINLPDNPNPIGNLVRALRFLVLGRANLGPNLVSAALNSLRTLNERDILEAESSSYRIRCLSIERLYAVRSRLELALDEAGSVAEYFRPHQISFPSVDAR